MDHSVLATKEHEMPEEGAMGEPDCERRDSGSLKNVAQRGNRGVGCGTHAELHALFLGATFFRGVEPEGGAASRPPRAR
jgi:hypothetical protein